MGGDSGGNINPLSTLEIFDPSTNSWSTPETKGSMTPRFWLSSAVANGKIYAMGGYFPHSAVRKIEVFTPGPLGVGSDATRLSISLSPNPTTGIISVQGAPANTLYVSVTNVLGKRMIEVANPRSSDLTLDLSHLPRGTYFVRLESASGVVMKKVVKE